MKLTSVLDCARIDVMYKRSRFWYRARNGQWTYCKHEVAEKLGLIGLGSYELIHDPMIKVIRMPTNNLVKIVEVYKE